MHYRVHGSTCIRIRLNDKWKRAECGSSTRLSPGLSNPRSVKPKLERIGDGDDDTPFLVSRRRCPRVCRFVYFSFRIAFRELCLLDSDTTAA